MPLIAAPDVCRVLQIANAPQAVGRLDDDEKGICSVDTPGGRQRVTFITESGLYHLIFTSRVPAAAAFRKWVTGTVLPAIRKDGMYVAAEEKGVSNVYALGPTNGLPSPLPTERPQI